MGVASSVYLSVIGSRAKDLAGSDTTTDPARSFTSDAYVNMIRFVQDDKKKEPTLVIPDFICRCT